MRSRNAGISSGSQPIDQHLGRPAIDERSKGGRAGYGYDGWGPDRPTVVYVGTVAIGLTNFELSEEVEVQYVDGNYSRIMLAAHDPSSASGAFGAPRMLFTGAFDFSQEENWTVGPDNSFIMIKADPTFGRQLRVVFNWFDELVGASKAN